MNMVEELDKLLELSTRICTDSNQYGDSEKLYYALLDLHNAISGCVQTCKNDIHRINHDLQVHVQSTSIRIKHDLELHAQSINNILGNAF
jgi:hypothetical protein